MLAVALLALGVLAVGPGLSHANESWTARTAAQANQWFSVAYGDGKFVAVSADGTNRVMTSPDGITWTAQTAIDDSKWKSVTYGAGKFVAVAFDGTNRVMTSPDGVNWTAHSATAAEQWRSVTYGGGQFVAVSNEVMTSPDEANWTARSSAAGRFWFSVTYGGGQFVAVSYKHRDEAGTMMTSPDGVTWTAEAAAEVNPWKSVAYGDAQFVAVSYDGTSRVMTRPAPPIPPAPPAPTVKSDQSQKSMSTKLSVGKTVVNRKNARTVQGQKMRAAVTKVRVKGVQVRGDISCYKVIKGPKRKLTLKINGQCSRTKIWVTYTAAGNGTYNAYKNTIAFVSKRG